MMSNSTLPLGFIHIITDRLALKELAVSLYIDVSPTVEFFLVCAAGGSDEVYEFNNFSANLNLVVWMDDELRYAIGVDETFAIVIQIHLKPFFGKTNQLVSKLYTLHIPAVYNLYSA